MLARFVVPERASLLCFNCEDIGFQRSAESQSSWEEGKMMNRKVALIRWNFVMEVDDPALDIWLPDAAVRSRLCSYNFQVQVTLRH